MIKLPGDAFVTIELVSGSSAHAPSRGDGFSHFAIKVESMDGVLAELIDTRWQAQAKAALRAAGVPTDPELLPQDVVTWLGGRSARRAARPVPHL